MKISPKAENDLDSDSDFIIPAEGTGNKVVYNFSRKNICMTNIGYTTREKS
jgi:hypothetical protein